MCRFLAQVSRQPVSLRRALLEAPHSLQKQCSGDLSGERHGDGWGIGYYLDGFPTVARYPTDAAVDPQLVECAERLRVRLAIAHVRQASVGTVGIANTHPFDEGCWLFAHNGTAMGFDALKPELRAEMGHWSDRPQGDTDSEWIFYWLLSRLTAAGADPRHPAADPAAVTAIMAASLSELGRRCQALDATEPTRLNFLLSDGVQLWATRYGHTLFSRSEAAPPGQIAAETTLIASEPLDDGDWREVPDQSILTVDRQLRAQVHPL